MAVPLVGAAKVAPAPTPPHGGSSPTSWAVSGGGWKLSNTGLRMSPSLAYLAEEKHWRGATAEVQRKVGWRRMERCWSCRGESTGGGGRKGAMGWGMTQAGWWWGCRSPTAEAGAADCRGWGGARRGGGGREDGGAAEEACWDEQERRSPVAGLIRHLLLPLRPRPNVTVRPR